MIDKIVATLPPRCIKALRRFASEKSLLNPLVEYVGRRITAKEWIIKHGVGKGLKFHPGEGVLPGQLIGTTDLEEQYVLAKHLNPGDVFYDIGANIGFYSTIAARLVGSNGHVYAFEPFSQSAQAARKNAAINHFDNVTVIVTAVSSRSGIIFLDTEGPSTRHFSVSGDCAQGRLKIKAITIDDFLETSAARPPNLVMIDVEGAELDVLQGMMRTLRSHRPVLMVEVHWLGTEFTRYVREHLEPLGYTGMALNGEVIPTAPVRCHVLLYPMG